MHTLIDLRGSIPAFIYISDGRCHNSNVLYMLNIVPGAIYTMDKAYVDFKTLARIDSEDGIFITRAKDNMKFEIMSSNFNIDESSGVVGDHLIRLTGLKTQHLYPKELRMIVFLDYDTGEQLTFISNAIDPLLFNGLEIANVYRHRWDIEVFFKWVKQNLTITHLWGHSENAVKTHLWVAISAYLLLAKVKAVYNSPFSITEIATLVSVSALMKNDLQSLVTDPQTELPTLFSDQNVNELNLFNNF